jgi:hypothetical protein
MGTLADGWIAGTPASAGADKARADPLASAAQCRDGCKRRDVLQGRLYVDHDRAIVGQRALDDARRLLDAGNRQAQNAEALRPPGEVWFLSSVPCTRPL